ncbi:MAG: DUF3098 domain-containing protein [Saprospiraceae bacterium]|nr:DUF3098 domain-containing protein [Saprospiraceae bacterium]MDW8228350.1 DUF3098 domain-containing protein [Saprospiraceae bacterium]
MAKQPQRRPNAPAPSASRRPASPAPSARKPASKDRFAWLFRKDEPFLFGRRNFIVMGAGLLLVVLGLIAMSGGHMPDPNTWDTNLIYSPRRITLAPMLMVAGFIVVAIGIFLKPDNNASATSNTPPTA